MSRAATARRFYELYELQNGLYITENARVIATLLAFSEEMRASRARLHISRGVFLAPGLPPAQQSFTAYVQSAERRSVVSDAAAAQRVLHGPLDARLRAGPCRAHMVVTYKGSDGAAIPAALRASRCLHCRGSISTSRSLTARCAMKVLGLSTAKVK